MNLVYGPSDLRTLVAEGDRASATAGHTAWLWARSGAKLTLSIGTTGLECVPAEQPSTDMVWRRLGDVQLHKGKRFRVAISAQRPYFESEPDLIGQLVLSPDPTFDPEKAQGMGRVLGNRVGPVADARMTLGRGTNTHFSFPPYRSRSEWERRASRLRQQILVGAGIWPPVERCPLNPRIFDRTEREDYTVEKAYFESYPGFFVTGNLYRPKGKPGPFPGLANPHGHWAQGRLADEEVGSVPGRCINFAKQGYVAFAYDMIGRNDSLQIPHDFRGDVEDLWGINLLGLQLWNSIRVVDFLQSLPDVDPERIGCTGTSGGGTQTFMLMAVDGRVKVAAPVCMVSGIMQGGCLCENSPSLRLDTYNAEIAALMAPRPLLLVAATGDWTRLNPEEEYPGIRSVYRLYGAEDKVKCVRFDAPHNYNRNSREAVYQWFAQWLLHRRDYAKVKEVPFAAEKRRDLLVFPDGKLPAGAADTSAVVSTIKDAAKQSLACALPRDGKMAEALLSCALATAVPRKTELAVQRLGSTDAGAFTIERLVLGRKSVGDQIPAVLFSPKAKRACPGVVVVHPEGKAALAPEADGRPSALVDELLAKGSAVLAIDTFLTGEHHTPFAQTERDTSERHFWTFHRQAAAERVQDILTAAAYLRARRAVSRVSLAGAGAAGLWALFAGAMDAEIRAVAVDANEFENADDRQWVAEFPVPSIRRVGDLATAAVLLRPRRLLIHNTGSKFDANAIGHAYASAQASKALSVRAKLMSDKRLAAWLHSASA